MLYCLCSLTLTFFLFRKMAEKPEDLNLPTSIVTKIIKEQMNYN